MVGLFAGPKALLYGLGAVISSNWESAMISKHFCFIIWKLASSRSWWSHNLRKGPSSRIAKGGPVCSRRFIEAFNSYQAPSKVTEKSLLSETNPEINISYPLNSYFLFLFTEMAEKMVRAVRRRRTQLFRGRTCKYKKIIFAIFIFRTDVEQWTFTIWFINAQLKWRMLQSCSGFGYKLVNRSLVANHH